MGAWRIDELAQHTGVSVDTIRFYQRERLLPAPEREGRHKIYGDEHVARLSKIRELQARRFSLAAIGAFLEGEHEGIVEGLFADDSGITFDLDGLTAQAAIEPNLVRGLIDVGLLREPAEVGRSDYDTADLEALRACRDLAAFGLPHPVIEALAEIYVDGVTAMQHQVVELFGGSDTTIWENSHRERFQHRLTNASSELLPLVTRIVDYVHYRTLQRLALQALVDDGGDVDAQSAREVQPEGLD